MTTYKFYTFTTIGFIILFVFITILTSIHFLRVSSITNLDSEIEATTKLTNQIANMAKISLNNKVSKEDIVSGIQNTIENTAKQNSFISIYDWSGKIVAYPNKTKVGTKAKKTAVIANLKATPTGEELYEILLNKDNTNEEIIYQIPIPSSDWIIAGHINTENVIKRRTTFRNHIYTSFFIISLLVILFVLGVIRMISNYYEKQISIKNQKFEDSFMNIEKLNSSLENYQKNLSEIQLATKETHKESITKDPVVNTTKETSKKRILTYVRNELLSIPTEELAYIYVDNTITYVIRKDGKRSTSSESLDQIFSNLDDKSFFRVNRQIIVAISAIDIITKYGNKLKLQLNPEPEIDIFIGKNKAAAFKQWLDL